MRRSDNRISIVIGISMQFGMTLSDCYMWMCESLYSFKRMSSSGSELFQDSHIQVLRPRDRCSDQTLSQYHHKNITVSSSNVRENDCNYLECPTDDSYVTMDIQVSIVIAIFLYPSIQSQEFICFYLLAGELIKCDAF